MVSPEVTQLAQPPHPRPTDWGRDSVRITAVSPQVRRQIEIDLLTREMDRQQIVAASECNDLKVLKDNGSPCATAERRASNATAVLQHLGSMLRAYGVNRDFVGQVAK